MKKGTPINDMLVYSTKGTMLGFIRGEIGNYDIDTLKVLPAYHYSHTCRWDFGDGVYTNCAASEMEDARKCLLAFRKGEIATILQETGAGSQVHLDLAKECCLPAVKEQATKEKPDFSIQIDNGLFYAGYVVFINGKIEIEIANLFATRKECKHYLKANNNALIEIQQEILLQEKELELVATKLSEHIEVQELNLLQDVFEYEMLSLLSMDKEEISANDLVSGTTHRLLNGEKLPNTCLLVSEKEALIKELLPNTKEKYALHKAGISGAYYAPLPNVDSSDLKGYLGNFEQLHGRLQIPLKHNIYAITAEDSLFSELQDNGLFRTELETSAFNTVITASCRFKAAFELLSIYYHYEMSIKHDLAQKWHFLFEEWLIRVPREEFSAFIGQISTINKINLHNGKHYYRCKCRYNGKIFLSLDYGLLGYRVLREYVLALLAAKDKRALVLRANLFSNILTTKGNLFHVANKLLS